MSRLLYFKASLPLLTPVKSPVRAKPRAQVLASGALWYVRCWNPASTDHRSWLLSKAHEHHVVSLRVKVTLVQVLPMLIL